MPNPRARVTQNQTPCEEIGQAVLLHRASGTFDSSLFFWGEGRLWGVEALFDTVFLALISLTTVFFAHGVKPASVCCPFFDLSIEPCGPAVVLAFFLEFLVCGSMCFILHRCR